MRKNYLLLALAFIFTVCSDEFSEDSFLSNAPDNYDNLLVRGWESFQNGEFEDAIELFQIAADRDATKPEPYLGLGWSYSRSGNQDYDNAMISFSKTLAFAMFDTLQQATLETESHAGQAYVSYAQAGLLDGDEADVKYQDAVDFAEMVIASDPDFELRNDTSIDSERLNVLRLQSHFQLGNINIVYSELVNSGHVFETVTSSMNIVEMSVTDDLTGLHSGTIDFDDDANGLIDVSSVMTYYENLDNGEWDSIEYYLDYNNNGIWEIPEPFSDGYVSYSVGSITEGGNTFEVTGNPLISPENTTYVTYAYAQNYGFFINELLEQLSNQ